jgi:prolyl-tRNA editing enzyme YbaK/EbsC (Cys-tRNA(Pro) deacylase)
VTLASVRTFLAEHAPDVEVLETDTSTATVALAAIAYGVEPGRIAKTLAYWLDDEAILVVMRGDARVDNRRFKDAFAKKAKMLDADAVAAWTGHPVGGVCPFGLARPMRVFADRSLLAFDIVVPAAGSTNSAVKIAPDRLAALVGATWIDVAQPLVVEEPAS